MIRAAVGTTRPRLAQIVEVDGPLAVFSSGEVYCCSEHTEAVWVVSCFVGAFFRAEQIGPVVVHQQFVGVCVLVFH
jgi:hypothetical protein